IGNGNRSASTGPDQVELLTLPQGKTVEFKQDAYVPGAGAQGDRGLLPAVRLPVRQRPGRRQSQDGPVEFAVAQGSDPPRWDGPGHSSGAPTPPDSLKSRSFKLAGPHGTPRTMRATLSGAFGRPPQ